MANQDWSCMREKLHAHGQSHLLHYLEDLSDTERDSLYSDLSELDLPRLSQFWEQARVSLTQDQLIKDKSLKPLDVAIVGSTARDKDQLSRWMDIGLDKISNNEVAVLLLAGGQGTRLNVSYPKGMYDVGLPSHKTLFQLQAERILKLQLLAKDKSNRECVIPWYIMTSEHTKTPILEFFKENNFFGLDPGDVIIFEQNTLPCLDFSGKVILAERHRIARAPDGNGGLYTALAGPSNTVLADMERRGVTSVHVYCVDNILVKMADPVFVGFCWDKGAECGAKVVKKMLPTERVGVICCYDDHYQVVEYSEISSHTAEMRNSDGSLTYSAGNIANHFFTVQFLRRICSDNTSDLCHHVAKKKIPYTNEQGQRVIPSEPNGIKLEKFVFDVFQFARSFSVLEVIRDEEFSPVKNAPGAIKDTPTTAKADLFNLHHRWILSNGGTIVDASGKKLTLTPTESDGGTNNGSVVCEISPLVSYSGEGLKEVCDGRTFTSPLHLDQPH